MPRDPVPFYFGLGSRYSYLAATQLDGLEERTRCRFEWLPLQSGALIRRANCGRSPFEGTPRSGQYDWAYRQRDAEAWADYYGVPYKEPAAFRLDPNDLAKACWAADREGKLKAMSWRIFRAVFVEGHVASRGLLSELAADIGLAGAELVAALDAPEIIARHEACSGSRPRGPRLWRPEFRCRWTALLGQRPACAAGTSPHHAGL